LTCDNSLLHYDCQLLAQADGDGAITVEATADDKFQLFHGIVTFEFDAAKGEMILKRCPIIFTKEK
jgi:hypothetical protein